MLNIAICDDEPIWLRNTQELINAYYVARGNTTAKIHTFSSGQDLLDALEDFGSFDLYVLDVVMPKMTGIELGKKLREKGSRGLILYLTTSKDFALDAYDAQPIGYLIKPVQEDKLYKLLGQATEMFLNRKNKSVSVKSKSATTRVPYEDIVYVEYADRACHYYLKDGTVLHGTQQRTSFAEVMIPLLTDSRFEKCGASLVLNLFYIGAIEKTKVVFKTPAVNARYLPQNAVAPLLSAWLDYWMEGEIKL
ncbi:MAG: response regulator transcription factor [Lachnospiraceae bacterium]|nr:response regulator transcription factor [Lachnospiraceae bacterium]